MIVRFLGTGTSQGVPVIACDCVVCLSDNTKDKRLRTSVLIKEGDACVVIDVGPDFRQQMLRSKTLSLDAALITHEHNDHIIGMDDIRPYNFKSEEALKVFSNQRVKEDLIKRFEYIFSPNPYPGAPQVELLIAEKNVPFEVKGMTVFPIEVMHGKLPILAYCIGDMCYITDAKTINDDQKQYLTGKKLLIINALHRFNHPSHLNLEEALQLIEELSPQKAYLTHISHWMGNHHDLSVELPENVYLAFDDCVIEI